MSFSSHAANKANNIYVLVKDFIQGISSKLGSSTTISAENLTQLILHNQAKDLYYLYTTMVILVIYLLIVQRN